MEARKADLWEMVKRTDGYIFASNFRTAMFVTYVFALSTASVAMGFWNFSPCSNRFVLYFLFPVAALFYIVSAYAVVYYSLSASTPDTGNGQYSLYDMPSLGQARRAEAEKLFEKYCGQDFAEDCEQLVQQYFELAAIANAKFQSHKKAAWWGKFILPSAFFLLLLLKVMR